MPSEFIENVMVIISVNIRITVETRPAAEVQRDRYAYYLCKHSHFAD